MRGLRVVVELLGRLYQVNQVLLVAVLLSELAVRFLVAPHETLLALRLRRQRRLVEVDQRARLRVQVRVRQDQLLVLQVVGILVRDVIPGLSLGSESFRVEAVFVLLQLGQEAWADFEIRPARVYIFKRFKQAPLVATHQEGRDHKASSVLRLDRLHQHALVVIDRLLHELVDFLGDLLSSVEESLLLVILPV